MSENSNTSDNSGSLDSPEFTRIKYGILQIGQILSLPVYLFVFFHILANKVQRKSLHNHVILVLLLFNFFQLIFDVSLVLTWLHRGLVRPAIPATCYFWNFMNYWAYYTGFLVILWASLERHILVFHTHLVRTKRGQLLFHYQPLVLILIYSTIYYIIVIFFYPCQNNFDYGSAWCGWVCYSDFIPNWLHLYEYLAHEIFPLFLEAFISILLILRVIVHKRRMHQLAEEWRKNRKMVLQLVSVSFICIIFNMPDVINPLFRLTSGIQPIPVDIQELILDYLGYGSCIFLPFACLSTIPHVKKKLKNVIDCRRWSGTMNNRRRAIIGIQTNIIASRR